MDERVKAIRADPEVGRGTCSAIDESYDDCDLVEDLDAAGISKPSEAVDWARDMNSEHMQGW